MYRKVLMIVAVVAAILVGVVAYAAWPRGATPVTEDEALDDFRSQTGSESSTSAATGLPRPGVYTYRSSGEEVVQLGVLPSETRPYPGTMSVVVVGSGPSCFTTTLNLIDQHTEDTTYCVEEGGGLSIESHEKHQQIGAVSPDASMTCDPATLVADGAQTSELRCTLALSGGPAELTATLDGTAESTGDTVTVGDEDVEATAVDVTYEISGDLSGSWRERTWFRSTDWLPLRIERELDLEGLATFTERSTLELTDLEPAT